MKKTIYIETTIPSYYHEERKGFEFQKDITRKWWDNERNNYLLYISEIVIDELEFGDYANKNSIIEFVYNLPRLEVVSEIRDIVEIYLNNYLMPRKHIGDAFHLATASYYKIEYLLTWNYQHLANINKQEHIMRINNRIGLSTPYIITPLQILYSGEVDEDVSR